MRVKLNGPKYCHAEMAEVLILVEETKKLGRGPMHLAGPPLLITELVGKINEIIEPVLVALTKGDEESEDEDEGEDMVTDFVGDVSDEDELHEEEGIELIFSDDDREDEEDEEFAAECLKWEAENLVEGE
jgi:hypothetical protein